MKNFLLTLFALAIAVFTYGQRQENGLELATQDFARSFDPNQASTNFLRGSRVSPYSDTIWFDGFDNPNTWVINNASPIPNGWSIGTTGLPWAFSGSINSTGGGNYAVMAPDDPRTGGALFQPNIITSASAIDISSYSNQNLVFHYEKYGARYYDTLKVQLSNDNLNWVTIDDNTDFAILTANGGGELANPTSSNIFIPSSLITGQDSLYVRFNWEANRSGVEGIGYGFFVDDIMVLDVEDNDMVLERTSFFDPPRQFLEWWYGAIPINQVVADSFYFSAASINRGKNIAYNVRLEIDITGPSPFNDVSPSTASVASEAVDTSITTGEWNPAATGLHTISWNLLSDSIDSNPVNNTYSVDIEITNNIYSAAPVPVSAANLVSKVGPPSSQNGGAFSVNQEYRFVEADTIVELGVAFDSEWTEPGQIFQLSLVDGTGTPLAATAFITITQAMIDDELHYFPVTGGPVPIQSGFYDARFEYFGGNGDSCWVVTCSDPFAPFEPSPNGGFFNRQTVSYNGQTFTFDQMPYLTVKTLASCTDPFTVSIDPASVQPAGCVLDNGQARVDLPAGHNPGGYTITWNGTVGPEFRTDLADTTYDIVVVNDTTGCEATTSVTIPLADAPDLSVSGIVASNCSPASGEASIVPATGNTTDYNYAWSDGVAGTDKDFRDDLMAGTYTVVVTELSTGCDTTVTIDITQVPGPDVTTFRLRDADCGVANGEAEVLPATGAATDYNYDWSDGVTGTDKDSRNDLLSGTYFITVTQLATGCDTVVSVNIGNIGGPVVDTSVVVDATCNGDSDGSIALTMDTIGTEPFTYAWSTGDTTTVGTLDNLTAGTYTVTVLDVTGCIGPGGPFVVNEPDAIVLGGTTDNDGEGCVTVAGGTAPYTYLWDNGETTECINVAAAGTYGVTVTDVNGCEQTGTVDIVVGLEDIRISSNVKVFPNPTSGQFNMVFNDLSGVHEVTVFNPLGQIIDNRRVSLGGQNVTIEYNDLELRNGVYFIVVKDDTGAGATFRLVVR
jgi:hypothetical protein